MPSLKRPAPAPVGDDEDADMDAGYGTECRVIAGWVDVGPWVDDFIPKVMHHLRHLPEIRCTIDYSVMGGIKQRGVVVQGGAVRVDVTEYTRPYWAVLGAFVEFDGFRGDIGPLLHPDIKNALADLMLRCPYASCQV